MPCWWMASLFRIPRTMLNGSSPHMGTLGYGARIRIPCNNRACAYPMLVNLLYRKIRSAAYRAGNLALNTHGSNGLTRLARGSVVISFSLWFYRLTDIQTTGVTVQMSAFRSTTCYGPCP